MCVHLLHVYMVGVTVTGPLKTPGGRRLKRLQTTPNRTQHVIRRGKRMTGVSCEYALPITRALAYRKAARFGCAMSFGDAGLSRRSQTA